MLSVVVLLRVMSCLKQLLAPQNCGSHLMQNLHESFVAVSLHLLHYSFRELLAVFCFITTA